MARRPEARRISTKDGRLAWLRANSVPKSVFCADEDAVVGAGSVDDHFVGRAGESDVTDVNNIVPDTAQQLDELG